MQVKPKRLRIGSRGSPLALRQTEIVSRKLAQLGVETEIHLIKTSGDVFLDKPLHMLSGRGVFVTEIDDQMLSGEIDLAVHSMKDIPTNRPRDLAISATVKRDSPFDILINLDGLSIDELKCGAVVGTSSMRRSAQIRRARPDLIVKSLRGNLRSRLDKLNQGKFDAIVLAEAGVQRMDLDLQYQVLDREQFIPSANQGAIAVVAKKDSRADACSKSIDDVYTRIETSIERKILEIVGGGCVVPMAVNADLDGRNARILAEVLSLDGKRFIRIDENIVLDEGFIDQSHHIGRKLMEMGGRELVDEAVNVFGSR